MRRPLAPGIAALFALAFSAPALADGPLNVLTVGPNYGNKAVANYVPVSPSPYGGYDHLGTTVTHIGSAAAFNALTAADLAAYDVVLTQWASTTAFNYGSSAVQDYVNNGGALFMDGDYANFNDLSWLGVTGATSYCAGPWLLDASALPQGDVLEADLPAYPDLVNCHGSFPNAGVLTPFMWDRYGTPAALAGVVGSGRVILTGPDHDYHASPGHDPEQYQFLLNELQWTGDACDPADASDDCDDDGVANGTDNCPDIGNADQVDADGDGDGDSCDVCPFDADNDIDGDTVCGDVDNCVDDANADQTDSDNDAAGDVCDVCPLDADDDADADGHCADVDNCPTVSNADQANADGDSSGDACDVCPFDADNDADADGFCADVDNCPDDANSDQLDFDADGAGDVCDTDDDNDGVDDLSDACQYSETDTDANVPSRSLKPNHHVWEGGSDMTRGEPNGRGGGTGTVFTMADTEGCTCAEIIDECGYGEGHEKFGCSEGVVQTWVDGGFGTCEE